MGTIDDPDRAMGPLKFEAMVSDHEKDQLFNATIKERDELKKVVAELTEVSNTQSAALQKQAETIAQQQAALQAMGNDIMNMVRVAGKLL